MKEDAITKIADKFLIGLNYIHPSDKPYYGLVTRNLDYIDADSIPESKPGRYIFYDLLTKSWIDAPRASVDAEFKIYDLDKISSINDPYILLDIDDEVKIKEYNNFLINKLEEKKNFILDLAKKCQIELTEEEIIYYTSLLETYYLDTLNMRDREDRDAVALCMVCKVSIERLFEENQTEEELKTARENWLKNVKQHSIIAKEKLDLEVSELDKTSEEYEIELEEISLIKNLIDDAVNSFKDKLEECTNFRDILTSWPPLLLPAPKYTLKWDTLKYASTIPNRSE